MQDPGASLPREGQEGLEGIEGTAAPFLPGASEEQGVGRFLREMFKIWLKLEPPGTQKYVTLASSCLWTVLSHTKLMCENGPNGILHKMVNHPKSLTKDPLTHVKPYSGVQQRH